MTPYVFVYGTLMSGCSNHYILQPYIRSIQPAFTTGCLAHLPAGYPMLFIGCGIVYGELVFLKDAEQALSKLDILEDYYGEDHPDNLYERRQIATTNLQDKQVSAWAYICPERHTDKRMASGWLIKSGDWRQFQFK